MNCIRFASVLGCWGLISATAWAHPGHALDQAWRHRLASPFHWLEALVLVLTIIGAGWLAARSGRAFAARVRLPLSDFRGC
jgi:hypothetical protein